MNENIKKIQTFFEGLKIAELVGLAVILLAVGFALGQYAPESAPAKSVDAALPQSMQDAVLPADGVVLPVRWGDMGKQMVESGVIDAEKFKAIYAQRAPLRSEASDGQGGLTEDELVLLEGDSNGKLRITPENAHVLLNLLWALGLGNKNEILTAGPMVDPQYGGDAGKFASTGGWTLARGNAMEHYSMHSFMTLTPEQQELVVRVSQGVYRPCCGNSVHFPDCNHGMAMLGLLELMAAQGATEDEMFDAALAVNSYWFPETYLTIAKLFQSRGVAWNDVDPREALGINMSSAQGYRNVLTQVEPEKYQGGGSCGV